MIKKIIITLLVISFIFFAYSIFIRLMSDLVEQENETGLRGAKNAEELGLPREEK